MLAPRRAVPGRGNPGNRLLFPELVLCLWLWAAWATPALAGRVTIVDDQDADPAAADIVSQAVDATQDLFREEFGTTLDHDVRLVLTGSGEDYAEALVRRNSQTRESAADWAARTAGVSSRGRIFENLGRQKEVSEKVFVAAHELAHQYEDQLSQGRHHQIMWLTEGVADYVGAKVVERVRLGSVADIAGRWGRQFATAPQRPSLGRLHGRADWAAAVHRHGGAVVYRASDLAVLRLVELREERALFGYFRRLRDMAADEAFRESFGLDLDLFERRAEQ